MAKAKKQFSCSECGAIATKWMGQCLDCGEWNCLVESIEQTQSSDVSPRFTGYAGESAQIKSLSDISIQSIPRFSSGLSELDRVLGGGIVPGSVTLIGGDPGVGKSTILLQALCEISQSQSVLYVTGEESLEQVSLRAQRLGLNGQKLRLLTETSVERIIQQSQVESPKVMVVDSIQTIYTQLLQSAPGGVAQVRESAAQLVKYAKQSGISIFLVGHVTKEGALAGPRVLEHMVDAVLYFEGEGDSRYRIIRAVKNRFGAVNELGIFAMTETGLKEIQNPSAIFLQRYGAQVSGSVVMISWEGSRPLLVEVQALVDTSSLGNPRRITVGLDQNRLAMLLAVLNRHGSILTSDQDVFLNVVGGVRITETSADLALISAVISSFKNKPLNKSLAMFGEIGLAGEIRPVPNGQDRIHEAKKHGFKAMIVPKANMPKKTIDDLALFPVANIQDLVNALDGQFDY
jgi:DNA repair protein RadA/Sms